MNWYTNIVWLLVGLIAHSIGIINSINDDVDEVQKKSEEPALIGTPWAMHRLDSDPPAGSDGVKLADVNGDGLMDLVCGFEEGGVSRIYIHPGQDKVREHWTYVELPSPDVEDAVLVDLDGDGNMDVVTASEGADQQIRFHWAPKDSSDYLKSEAWETETVPVMAGVSAWMFVVPHQFLEYGGPDLIVGSKRKPGAEGLDEAVVGWLQSPDNPREVNDWTFHPITTAGWIMSIDPVDMNGDGMLDILISDRRSSSQTGVRWLKNPGPESVKFYQPWESIMVGLQEGEPMFLTRADLDEDGQDEILVPDLYRGLTILDRQSDHEWVANTIAYPDWAGGRGKAVACGDIDLDGRMDFVLSFEEEGKVASIPFSEYQKNGKYSVVWAKTMHEDGFQSSWEFYKVSGMAGRKFDLVNLIDMDGDGDLDILTNDENEENDGLGVVWYENPVR